MENTEMKTAEPNKSSSMKKRCITAAVYVLVLIGLCTLKWMVPDNWGALGFDAIFTAVAVIGCNEFLTAISNSERMQCKISLPQKVFTLAFCAVIVPLHTVCQITMSAGILSVACAFTVYAVFIAATSVFDHERSTVKGAIFCMFCMLYCGVLSSILSSINHLPKNSMVAIILLFLCTNLTDTGAFVIGSLLKKYIPLKLAPQLSPNKTVIGAVGGLIGGIVGAICAYFIITLLGGVGGFNIYLTFSSEAIHPLVSFILVGLCTSVVAQVGDLFESALKRECGVKDMGYCLPGHGGVLDRFDSMLYCSVVVLFCFGTIIF